MAIWRIPTRAYPTYTQTSDLDGETFSLRFRWSQRAACWHLDVHTLDGVPVVLSVRLVVNFPLLRRVVNDVRPPGELIVADLTGPGEEPTLEDFGTRFALFYFDAEELGRV